MNRLTFHTIDTGLRIVHLHVPGAQVGHFGLAVAAGSCDEPTHLYGLAHFVEHTIFKGTARRSSWHIINRMESVGGELNAFTTKEDTVVYSAFPKGSLLRAVELIVDLVLNSKFPKREIDKEREVICDEINSYLDTPSEAVYDDFEDLILKGTPLGHNILGTIESVRAIDSDACRRWLEQYYVATNMVAFYAGSVSAESFIARTSSLLGLIPRSDADQHCGLDLTSHQTPFQINRKVDTHQSHTVMGCALARPDIAERLRLALVTNILGGPGMNSLLNVALREKRGLVYNVESSLSNWRDCSLFTTYFGSDSHDNDHCIGLITREIERLASDGLTERGLRAAKKQYRGQVMLSRENVENRTISIARSLLQRGTVLTDDEAEELLDSITAEQLSATAARLLPLSRLTLL